MRTATYAREIAETFLGKSEFASEEPTLLLARTEEFPEGWVFWYQSARFVRTGDPEDGLLGNAPLFVPREEQPPVHISYHRSTLESMEAYRCSGNANARALPAVGLSGWEPGASVLAATQLVRSSSNLGLAAAKRLIENCLEGKHAQVQLASVPAARELAVALRALGFHASVAHDA